MKEAFDIMGNHPLLTIFLVIMSISALESVCQTLVYIFRKQK